jgi:hypothetical protein
VNNTHPETEIAFWPQMCEIAAMRLGSIAFRVISW